jgi:hypothetical protein
MSGACAYAVVTRCCAACRERALENGNSKAERAHCALCCSTIKNEEECKILHLMSLSTTLITIDRPLIALLPPAIHSMRALLLLLVFLLDLVTCFPLQLPAIRSATRCAMGGYYSEPVDNRDDDLQHLIFGVNCYEKTFDVIGDSSITYLEPVDDEDYSSKARQLAELMVCHLDLSTCRTIIELGCSSVVSLVAARSGATQVVAYNGDETRLRILQYADLFLNTAGGAKIQTQSSDETSIVLEPTTDLVVVTSSLSDAGRLVLQDAMDRHIPVLVTNDILQGAASCRNGITFLDVDQKLIWK